jgi:membrane-bound lytic murein transglycosylase B
MRAIGRTASRATVVSSLLLPMPVAFAGPNALTLSEEVLGVSDVPVSGVGDPAHTHADALAAEKARGAGILAGPAVSVTRVARSGEKAAADAPSKVAANGIPAAALRAYRTAEATMSIADPSCGLSWGLLAGIGRVESDHGRYGGAVLGNDGTSTPQILGLPLNGVGPVAAIADTDNGELDGDTRWDRAVGPLQFIPSTWAMVGVDGDGDGNRDPHDIDDAALAAAAYLCVGDNDLSTPAGVSDAVYSYNHSADYVALVTGIAHAYASGAVALPLTATLALPTGPGVTVGLNTGHGVPIGATDDVSSPADGKGTEDVGRHSRDHGAREHAHQDDVHRHGDEPRSPVDEPRRHEPRHHGAPKSTEQDATSTETEPKDRHTKPSHGDVTDPHTPTPEENDDAGSGTGSGPVVDKPPVPEAPVAESTAPEEAAAEQVTPEEPVADPEEYTGTVADCGNGTYCLDTYVLDAPDLDEAMVGQVITVVAVLEGDTLIVNGITG